MKKSDIYNLLRGLAILDNLLFILWVLFNAIDEGFKGTIYQIISATGLWALLSLNIFLLATKNKSA